MAEKPIIFSTAMVQAILDGRKTQTRRVIKPQPTTSEFITYSVDIDENEAVFNGIGTTRPIDSVPLKIKPGDILWVRETWCKLWALDSNDQCIDGTEKYYYAADGYNPTPFNHFPDEDGFSNGRDCPRWRSSIHMPRAAARIFLRVTDVRVERVQEISIKDSWAEGLDKCSHKIISDDIHCGCHFSNYSKLWNTLNAKRGYGWDVNPWVWVITFERVI